jgi:hypothetical protein
MDPVDHLAVARELPRVGEPSHPVLLPAYGSGTVAACGGPGNPGSVHRNPG